MRSRIKSRLCTACLIAAGFLGPVLGTGSVARADDTDLQNDARIEGYRGKSLILDVGVAPYYLVLGAMGVLAVVVMFKDAKRSHLD